MEKRIDLNHMWMMNSQVGLQVSWSVNSYEFGNTFTNPYKEGRGERERSIKNTQENVFTSLLTFRRGQESNNPNSQLKLELPGKDNWHCGLLVLSFEMMLMDSFSRVFEVLWLIQS